MFGISLQPVDFDLARGLLQWGLVFGIVGLVSIVVAIVTSFAMYGAVGPARVGAGLGQAVRDFASLSPRRVFAISSLTFKEAIRRKALLVFVVFAVLFMFASWFLTGDSNRPELDIEVYVGFVFTAVSWLVLPVAMLLACWGIPEDIRVRSLHTVVTKPARRNEVVIGRMLGFSAITTLIVVIMGAVGYVWIVRQVPANVPLICRVPIYGDLYFLDRTGEKGDAVNVGDIVETRKFIEGGSKAAGIWTFPVPSGKPDKLRFESRFEAFRTFKGDMNRTLRVRYTLLNDAKKLSVPLPVFNVAEFSQNERDVERKIEFENEKREKQTFDLYDDLVNDGNLVVKVQCLDRGQYIGVSKGDFFVRQIPDHSFAFGYWKAMCGVWLMIILIVMIGVTASCFVKGPIATLLCFCVVVLGQPAHDFMDKVVAGKQVGGGALESVYRLITQMNQTVPLPEGGLSTAIQAVDRVPFGTLWLANNVIPDLRSFWMAGWVGKGLDVPWSGALLPSIAVTLGFALPCILLGYFSLLLRELEAK